MGQGRSLEKRRPRLLTCSDGDSIFAAYINGALDVSGLRRANCMLVVR